MEGRCRWGGAGGGGEAVAREARGWAAVHSHGARRHGVGAGVKRVRGREGQLMGRRRMRLDLVRRVLYWGSRLWIVWWGLRLWWWVMLEILRLHRKQRGLASPSRLRNAGSSPKQIA